MARPNSACRSSETSLHKRTVMWRVRRRRDDDMTTCAPRSLPARRSCWTRTTRSAPRSCATRSPSTTRRVAAVLLLHHHHHHHHLGLAPPLISHGSRRAPVIIIARCRAPFVIGVGGVGVVRCAARTAIAGFLCMFRAPLRVVRVVLVPAERVANALARSIARIHSHL